MFYIGDCKVGYRLGYFCEAVLEKAKRKKVGLFFEDVLFAGQMAVFAYMEEFGTEYCVDNHGHELKKFDETFFVDGYKHNEMFLTRLNICEITLGDDEIDIIYHLENVMEKVINKFFSKTISDRLYLDDRFMRALKDAIREGLNDSEGCCYTYVYELSKLYDRMNDTLDEKRANRLNREINNVKRKIANCFVE